MSKLKQLIEDAFEHRASLTPGTLPQDLDVALEEAMNLLDSGQARVAEPKDGGWVVNQWLKKAVLLYFRAHDNAVIDAGFTRFFDKVPLKYAAQDDAAFRAGGTRVVPGAIARRGAYVAPNVILMPSYVNLGAYVDSGTMVDTWATVGSCAQIGKGVHLSGGVGIGGVLEPPGATPVIIEDGAFIGSRAIVVEGCRIGAEAVLGANVVITSSTKIIDVTGAEPVEHHKFVPPRSVVIPGTRIKKFPAGDFGVPCALIIGQRKSSTDTKVSLNDALRDFGVSV